MPRDSRNNSKLARPRGFVLYRPALPHKTHPFPMHLLRLRCFAFLLLVGVSAALAADEHPVTVKKNPTKIARRSFDPNRPPAAMPKLTPPESGVCHFEFTCDAGIGVFVDQTAPNTVEVEVDSVDLVLDLAVDVWAKNGAPPKLVQHEEGHRQICEYYYKDADAIARRLGKAMIGRKATGTGKDKAAATEAAQQKLLTELNLAYMTETRVRCSACFVRYDAITNHGLKPIGEAEAIAQAIAEEPAVISPDAFPPAGGGTSIPTKTK